MVIKRSAHQSVLGVIPTLITSVQTSSSPAYCTLTPPQPPGPVREMLITPLTNTSRPLACHPRLSPSPGNHPKVSNITKRHRQNIKRTTHIDNNRTHTHTHTVLFGETKTRNEEESTQASERRRASPGQLAPDTLSKQPLLLLAFRLFPLLACSAASPTGTG